MDKIPTNPTDIEKIKLIREWEQKNVPNTAINKKFKRYKNYYAPQKIIKNSMLRRGYFELPVWEL